MVAFAAAAAIVVGCSGGEDGAGRVWFVDGHMSALGMRGKIENVARERIETPARALAGLLKGPTQAERAEGLASRSPTAPGVETVSVSSLKASVRLRSPAPAFRWRSDAYASAQIVYTLTELDHIERVELFVNGERCCMYDTHSRPIDRPLTRRILRGWQGDPLPPPG